MRPTLGNCCAFEVTLILFHSISILCIKIMSAQGNSPLYPNLNEIITIKWNENEFEPLIL
jgi:hypothetical protein